MAWYHRRLCLDNIPELDLIEELEWLDSITVENQKNYQIWHHRKVIIEKLNDPSHEKPLLEEVFADEPKNFHAWCHRIWVVRRFNLYEGELEFIENKLKEDIRNNSVWNYRFFIINQLNNNKPSEEVLQKEIEYTLDKIIEVPCNESPYSYIRGWLKPTSNILKYNSIKSTLENIIENYPDCYHAFSLLLEWYEQEGNKTKSFEIIETLIKIDHIRAKYWAWRKNNISL
jgi:protein farnesyltransferase/geranylgeranyltransferase type-1 subunit alpha